MMRTMWLSFADPDTGKNRGVAIVDVTDEEIASAKVWLIATHPNHQPGAEVIKAAITKAWDTGCNPGGEVASSEISPDVEAPRNRLMQRDELLALNLI